MARSTLRSILGGALLLFAWLGLPGLWQWVRNPAPVAMAFEDYLNQGARPDWVQLKGVYVDNLHRVQTLVSSRNQSPRPSYAYFPLRLGPGDTRPVKVFLRPVSYVDSLPVAVLAKPGEASLEVSLRAQKEGKEGLQEVQVVRLLDLEANADVRMAIQAGSSLPADPDLIVVEQNGRPLGGHDLPALILFGALLVGFAATFLGSKSPRAQVPGP